SSQPPQARAKVRAGRRQTRVACANTLPRSSFDPAATGRIRRPPQSAPSPNANCPEARSPATAWLRAGQPPSGGSLNSLAWIVDHFAESPATRAAESPRGRGGGLRRLCRRRRGGAPLVDQG